MRFVDERYAIIDLCLQGSQFVSAHINRVPLQLLGLPRRQDLAHVDGGRYIGSLRLLDGFLEAMRLAVKIIVGLLLLMWCSSQTES